MTAQHIVSDQFQHTVEDSANRLCSALHTSQTSHSHHQWLDLLINRTITEPRFRIQALRFIDVLPSLEDDQSLAEHLQEYFSSLELPRFAEWLRRGS